MNYIGLHSLFLPNLLLSRFTENSYKEHKEDKILAVSSGTVTPKVQDFLGLKMMFRLEAQNTPLDFFSLALKTTWDGMDHLTNPLKAVDIPFSN